jgi:hypothetical protein
MSKWARVVDGIVVETTNIDPMGRFTDELVAQFKECPEEVEQGWQYVNGVFSIRTQSYVIRNGIYMYDYYQSGDTVVTERPTATNTYTSYEWGTIPAIAGKRSYAITTNFVAGDTLTLCGVTLTLGTDVIGQDTATTATNLQTVLSANTTINALYAVTVADTTITLTEITAGGENAPSEATTTGTGVIANGTATTSTPQTTGWKIDLATSLDALNSSYDTGKKRMHEAHSTVLIALALGKITQEQSVERINVVASEYGVMWNDILAKQEVLKNG